MTNLETSAAVIITRPPEIIACLKLRLSTRNVFIIFDSHPRPSYPKGAGAIVSTSVEGTARRLTELLHSVDVFQWQGQLQGNCSGHVFLPHSLDPPTTALWQAVLETNLAHLSLLAEISELHSQNEFQVSEQERLESELRSQNAFLVSEQKRLESELRSQNAFQISEQKRLESELRSQNALQVSEQKRLESELKVMEERSQRQEKTIQELRSSPSKTYSPHTVNLGCSSPSSTSRPFIQNNLFLNSNLIRNDATTHSTSSPSVGLHDIRGNPRDYRLPYAKPSHGEFDNGDRTPYAEPPHTSTSSSTGSRSAGLHDTRWTQPPSNRDDRLSDSRRLQGEFDSRNRGLSVEQGTPIRYASTSHSPASPSAGPHDRR